MAKQDKAKRVEERGSGKKRLFLLRHAKAVLAGQDVEDFPRDLAERGREQMSALVAALAEKPFAPSLVLVSPAARTLQTLELLRPRLVGAKIEIRDPLYLASADLLLEMARGVDDGIREALIVGHNPGLHDLATALLAPDSALEKPKSTRRLMMGFPTGSLVAFEFSGSWAALEPGSAVLKGFLRPKDLMPAAVAG